MATPTEPATSAIFRALRSVDVDPDLVLIPNSYRWAFFVPFSVVFQFGLGVVKGTLRRFAPWTAPGRSEGMTCL